MAKELLRVRDLTVCVEDREILHGINFTMGRGETHVLMGPNGAGKSTFGHALMGNPGYTVTGGSILFEGKELREESADARAKAGLFLSFQNPLEVPGISLANFIRSALEQRSGERVRFREFQKEMQEALKVLQMDASYARRDLNVGFSGGEKKKAEILQLLLLRPALAILDETDSGLDVDAVRTVSRGIQEYQASRKGALLIITHSARILEALSVDRVHVMEAGRMAAEGDASLIQIISERGYEPFTSADRNGGISV